MLSFFLVTFDPTVSLGALIAGGMAMVSIVAAAAYMRSDIRQAKEDVATMKPKVDKIEVLVQGMADGKERMDRMERDHREDISHLYDEIRDLRGLIGIKHA